jgi:hypothetical protein
MYYGDDSNYGNSNNSVLIGAGYNPASTNFDAQSETQYFGSETSVSITPGATAPQTITVPAGDYISLALDAVLTGNTNPSGGVQSTGNRNIVQPSFLGLSELGMAVSSSDTNASMLTPIPGPNDTPGSPHNTFKGVPSYLDSININQSFGPNGGGYNVTPSWGVSGAGDVYPNKPGYSGTHTEGSVGFFEGGLAFFPAGGNTGASGNSAAGINELEQFAAANNVASYSNSTDFFDNLIFQALQPGEVTLSPFVITNSTEYWMNTSVNPTSTSAATTYATSSGFDGTVSNVPSLVIDIQTVPEPASIGVLGLGALGLLRRRQRPQG